MLLLPAAYLLGRMFFGPGGGLVVIAWVELLLCLRHGGQWRGACPIGKIYEIHQRQ